VGWDGGVQSHSRTSCVHVTKTYLHFQYCATVKSNNGGIPLWSEVGCRTPSDLEGWGLRRRVAQLSWRVRHAPLRSLGAPSRVHKSRVIAF